MSLSTVVKCLERIYLPPARLAFSQIVQEQYKAGIASAAPVP